MHTMNNNVPIKNYVIQGLRVPLILGTSPRIASKRVDLLEPTSPQIAINSWNYQIYVP